MSRSKSNDPLLDQWIGMWLENRISRADSDALQAKLIESPEARQRYQELVRLDAALRDIAEAESNSRGSLVSDSKTTLPETKRWLRYAIAASLALACAWGAYQVGRRQNPPAVEELAVASHLIEETELAGCATLRRVAGVRWPEPAMRLLEGDLLSVGPVEFLAGVMEVDFFCGASVVVEGPATLELESDWSMRLHSGRLRATVPPAARGFVVKAADSEIIDLGTEFAVEVGADAARVEVIDGEVELSGGRHDGKHLLTGDRQSLAGEFSSDSSLSEVSTIADVHRRNEAEQQERLAVWTEASQQYRNDPRLIAYYPIIEMPPGRQVPNLTGSRRDQDGVLVGGVERTEGRFGRRSTGFKFDQPGSRVRVRIDGEFEAFTMMCWVRIDDLEHRFNALFMGDGYENGEPHWQIRNDGKMMFSVMVDDTQDVRVRNRYDNQIVRDAGKHRVYFTPPIWEPSQSGQWFFLVAVYDPVKRVVRQYVNAEEVASEAITDEFAIDRLRIGRSEIGNWGQPFRPTPWFAVRNLNGVIDELAIYNAAFEPDEIQTIYTAGKPDGY
ncbi:LamG-like jellyroll fold domain-containing protein [Neorhodopirellula pilleata]|uniref:FecR protein n=1 Tax=Neorhodopirellula pilleata TaxID=2714738 RepID=A0A5C6AHX3_9BACT|nr:LamG-like jellyroll fold domain-containing protein [Neorhodopirellula pilleata]TWT98858.1 FecR protein [Neorhodopirellula pilleata]